ncbi:MAG: DUF4401 domain-containing protein [Deferribacteres bacterium]|nr:DUF4401 domain-containing protein [Deferribacteres bacterium]
MDEIFRVLDDKIKARDPLYIRILYGIGAWFSAIFIIMFLGVSELIKHGIGAAIFGAVFLGIAIIISRRRKSTFLSQLSLALAFSGNILVLSGIPDIARDFSLSTFVIAQAVICGIVYPLFRNNIYRFLSPLAAAALATAWVVKEQIPYLMHVIIAAETILFGILILRGKIHSSLVPLVYSAAAMLPATLLFLNLTRIDLRISGFSEPDWPSSVLISAGMVYMFINLAGGLSRLRQPWLILVIGCTILLGIFTTPGILVAIGLLVTGYMYGDRVLTGLSCLFLPGFLVLFYYALNIDLAYKSWILAGSGLLLLIVRWIANLLSRREEAV